MKRTVVTLLEILIYTLLLCACGRVSTTVDIATSESIPFTIAENFDASAFVASVEFLPLTESDKHIIPAERISKVCVTANKIAIGSKEFGKLNIYDSDGNFLYEIDKKGNGNGEYLEVANFTLTDSIIYILDNYKHSIHKYSSKEGKYLSSDIIPFVAWDIEAFNDNSFLCTMIPNNPAANLTGQNRNCAVWQTNGKWEVEKSFIPLQEDYYEMYGKSRYFTKNGDKITFHILKDNGYYIFDNKQSPQFVKLQFDNPLPETFEGRVEDANKLRYDFLSETPFVDNHWTIMRLFHNGYEDQYLYDGNTKKFVLNSTTAKNGLLEIVGFMKDSPIGIMPDYEIYSMLKDNGFTKADSKTEDLLKRGGLALVKYKMLST